MPTLAPMAQPTAASREAESNWQKNLAALRANQPDTASLLEQVTLDLDWVYARDGSLTAMTIDGKWWQQCSVPALAGRAILKSLESLQVSSCMLAPEHAGLVRAAMDNKASVLFVIQPEIEIARVILSCHDFSDPISRHRFWMACGENWPNQLRQLLDAHPGLGTPTRFIRTKLSTADLVTALIATAQDVFSAVVSDRSHRMLSLKTESIPSTDRRQVLLVGGTDFRLWENGTAVLENLLANSAELTVDRFDTDAALNGSPLTLLRAATACGSVVSANLCRVDCNHLISNQMPWITWITHPAVPAFDSAGPFDALVIADANWRAITRKAGWPDHRVQVCGWPIHSTSNETGQELSLICDTHKIEIPQTIKDFSSHRLLWELIEEELHSDPLAVEKIDAYLSDRAGQLNINIDALDARRFVSSLILPAYQQGLARMLIAEKLPIGLWGKGWSDRPEFAAHHRGGISNSETLELAIAKSAGLICPHPVRAAHPIEAVGKPIVHRSGRDRSQLLRRARGVLGGAKDPAPMPAKSNLGQIIWELIRTAGSDSFRKAG